MDESYPYWENVKEILTTHFPDLTDRVIAAVFDRNNDHWCHLREELRQIAAGHEV